MPDSKNSQKTTTEAELGEAKASLDVAAYNLLMEELEYDCKCIDVYLQKLSNYKIRLVHQRDEWVKKRLDRAKGAVDQWMRAKAMVHQEKESYTIHIYYIIFCIISYFVFVVCMYIL